MQRIDSLSEYQSYLRGMLFFFDKLCRDNGIQYTILDGTLLGAIRNKGFIPWDGDIDVAVTWNNLEKLKNAFDKYHGRFYLSYIPDHWYKRIGFHRSFGNMCAKIIDTKSDNQLFGIDVFTIDFLGDDYQSAIDTVKEYRGLHKKARASIAFHLPHISSGKSFVRNLKVIPLFIMYPILKIVSLMYTPIWYRQYKKLLPRIQYPESSKYFTIQPYLGRVGVLENTILDEGYEDIAFDKMIVMAVRNHDAYLVPTYHDYMTPPPKDKQVPFPSENELKEIHIEHDDEFEEYIKLANPSD